MVALKSTLLALLARSSEALAITTEVVCTTRLGTVSIPANKIPPANTTVINQVTVIKRIVREVNVIVVSRPRTTTRTETAKATTTTIAPPDVKTVTKTVTGKKSTTVTTTISTSVSSTITTKYTTSIVSAPGGFTQLLGAPHYIAKTAAKELPAAPINPKADSKYVQRVDCTKRVLSTIIKAINTTVHGPHKTLPAQTKVKVITSTTTIVETKFPGKVTKYSTTTTSPTTTVWSTITSGSVTTELVTVETIILAVVPYYEACGFKALLSMSNGGNGVILTLNGNVVYLPNTYIDANSLGGYNCCVECIKSPGCLLSQADGSITCYNYIASSPSNVCPAGQKSWASYCNYPNTPADSVFANGPCGCMANLGLQ
ncbi:hypothetical protein FOMG_07572 [Fusarium oxysporum f. sp. melonis 26406]|uniref:Apple domain-containing protein n=1 Tax=Fusarium oxysporum f. sp. melonis 26406 TaxID=1089452 RepID=X0AJS1_FUSOX|nr:hypothetical protein FOMG_07572 [Fusarium oxysporum f. sp. melonis 26406]